MCVWVGTLEVEGKGGTGRDCEVGSAFFLCRVVGVKNVLGFWDEGRGRFVGNDGAIGIGWFYM